MKRCRQCRAMFEPRKSLQVVCSPECAIAYAPTAEAERLQRAARRREVRDYRVQAETLAGAARKAQAAFNRWVRLRDTGRPCVSCGHRDDGTRQRHASHYRPAGPNPALRFEPDNCHASCSICNNHKSGNLIPYKQELIRRIGLGRVEWLEGPHELPHRTVNDIREIARTYSRLAREIEKERE